MKVRRRMSRPAWSRMADWFRLRRAKPKNVRWLDADASRATEDPEGSVVPEPPDFQGSATNSRRSTPKGRFRRFMALLKTPWLYPMVFVVFIATGYIWAATVFFPAPFFTSNLSVPSVVGLARADAEEALTQAGFSTGDVNVLSHPSAPTGQVVWQDPVGEMTMPQGTRVEIFVSGGPQQIPVPDVGQYEAGLARRLVEASGIRVARVESVQTAAPKGVAVNTRPTAGTMLRPGAAITLVVSRGAPTIGVPDLTGLTLEQAQDSLERVGLTLGTFWRMTTSAQPDGTVFRTEPPAGTLTAPLTPVNLTLARAP